MRLDGKVAVVTGGAGGIGRGIVRAFTKEGAKVLFVDINDDAGQALAAELDGAATFLNVDISRENSAEQIRDAAIDAFGSVHVLVNNAHVSRQLPFLETTQEMFDLSFGTGFYPTFWLMRACYPQLKQNQGSVINFCSGAGLSGMPTQASYAAAKEAIRGISRSPPTSGPRTTSTSTSSPRWPPPRESNSGWKPTPRWPRRPWPRRHCTASVIRRPTSAAWRCSWPARTRAT